jgi:hypothetical protein
MVAILFHQFQQTKHFVVLSQLAKEKKGALDVDIHETFCCAS